MKVEDDKVEGTGEIDLDELALDLDEGISNDDANKQASDDLVQEDLASELDELSLDLDDGLSNDEDSGLDSEDLTSELDELSLDLDEQADSDENSESLSDELDLLDLNLDEEIELIVDEEAKVLHIRSKNAARAHWDEEFKQMHENQDDTLLIDDGLDLDIEDYW